MFPIFRTVVFANPLFSNLSSSVYELLDDIDLSEIQTMVDSVDEMQLFQVTVREKIESILKGEYFTNYQSLASAIISLIFGDIRTILPFLFTLVAIGLLCNLIGNLRSENKSVVVFSDISSF